MYELSIYKKGRRMKKDRTQVHTRYKLKSGKGVVGTTTVIGQLDKPALVHWSWKLGTEGRDYRKVRDGAASIGTLTHLLVESHIKNTEPDLSEFSPADVDKAENAFLAFLEWRKAHNLETVACEKQLVSETFEYGGTLDWVAKNNGELWLIDFKTGKDIYEEARYQLAAYEQLWNEENYQRIDKCNIILLGKEDGSFRHETFPKLEKEWEVFHHLLQIYKLRRT